MRPKRVHVHFGENMIKYICVNNVIGYTTFPPSTASDKSGKEHQCNGIYGFDETRKFSKTSPESMTGLQMSFPSKLYAEKKYFPLTKKQHWAARIVLVPCSVLLSGETEIVFQLSSWLLKGFAKKPTVPFYLPVLVILLPFLQRNEEMIRRDVISWLSMHIARIHGALCA